MSQEIKSRIWVFIEQRQGRPAEAGLEIAARAMDLARPAGLGVAGVVAGSGLEPLAQEILSYGLDEVVTLDHPLLAEYCNRTLVKALEGPIREHRPEVVLMGATALGVDLAPRLAARLRTGLSAHCVDLELDQEGGLTAVVPGWGGSFMARISCPKARPQMATVMPGVFPLPKPGLAKGRVIALKPDLEPQDVTYRVVEVERSEARESSLEGAEVVVAGGWGLGGKDGWEQLEELARALGGAVGATRPAVDETWAKEEQMIGTSGRTVRPRLYIGVALSGHPHHLVGVKEPELAVGINQDPKAALFDHCHLGLVGDYKEIVPALVKAIKARAGEVGE